VWHACLLAMIAGYADSVGYLRYGAFAGMMTGNTTLLGIALVGGRPIEALGFATIIAAFFAGVLVSHSLLRLHLPSSACLILEALLLAICAFIASPWGAVLLAFAMGVQSAAGTRFGGVTVNTVFITGNLQRLGEALVGGTGRTGREPGTATLLAAVWLCYAMGAVLGAAMSTTVRWPLLVPALAAPLVILRLRPA
jgi:uncharacterized membrane protein YoaK (UPF0700 family)